MAYKCINGKNCEYGPTDGVPANAYSQDEESWKAGKPRYNGFCLNCLDDDNRDKQAFENL